MVSIILFHISKKTTKEALFITEKVFSVIMTWQRKQKFCNYSEVQNERNPAASIVLPYFSHTVITNALQFDVVVGDSVFLTYFQLTACAA